MGGKSDGGIDLLVQNRMFYPTPALGRAPNRLISRHAAPYPCAIFPNQRVEITLVEIGSCWCAIVFFTFAGNMAVLGAGGL